MLSDGQSLLMKAVETNNVVIVERLLKANLQTNFSNETGDVCQLADKFQKKIVTGELFNIYADMFHEKID